MRKKIGSGITDSNGVASCNYTGKAVGKMNVVAETKTDDRILQSEIYELCDCIKYDKGNTANTLWTLGNNSNAQLDLVDNSYRKLSEITTGTDAWVYLKIDHQCALEFDIKVTATTYADGFAQFGQSANANTRRNINFPSAMQNGNWHHVKLALENGVVTLTSDELTSPVTFNLQSYDSTMDLYFRFRTVDSVTEISFKEFEYYPI